MTEAVAVISYPPAKLATAPSGPSISELCATARALMQPILGSDERWGPELEAGFADLAKLVDDFEGNVVGRVASYVLDEALASTRRIRDVGNRERGIAADEVSQAQASIAALGTVPPVPDLAEGLIDQEIRGVVRGLSAAKRDALLDEMRAGSQVRAMLASARHPMPTDFDLEAARLYRQFSDPAKRRNLTAFVEIYAAKKAVAQTLIETADAARNVVTRFIELEAALQAESEAARTPPSIARPNFAPPVTLVPMSAPVPRATVHIEGSAITRIA